MSAHAASPNGHLREGIHSGVTPERYHADPAPLPSLSSGVARLLIDRSPRHAWFAHPRLGGGIVEGATPAMEEGTILHSLILGTDLDVEQVDAPDWRTKAAQQARLDARARGALPILDWRMAQLERVAVAFREQLAAHECVGALAEGQAEATMIWREGLLWCRARPDWLRDDPRAPLYDLKTTGGSADPDTWERRLREEYAMQAAFYLRGARALGLTPSNMVFLVIETDAPYGMCAFQPDPALLDLAEHRIADALTLWEECLRTDTWPGYPNRICTVEPPSWMLAREEERRERAAWERRQKPTRQQIETYNRIMLEDGARA